MNTPLFAVGQLVRTRSNAPDTEDERVHALGTTGRIVGFKRVHGESPDAAFLELEGTSGDGHDACILLRNLDIVAHGPQTCGTFKYETPDQSATLPPLSHGPA